MASMPSVATETVCVLGKKAKVVPVAECGMPCCAKQTIKPAIERKEKCCAEVKQAPSVRSQSDRALCPMASMDCRCETRIIAAPSAGVALSDQAAASPQFEHVALITFPGLEEPTRALLVSKPGIVGLDSGPPRKLPRSPSQSRAPPDPV